MTQLVAPQHDPEATKQCGMVYELWNDGEITLTKSGELYRQRNLHQMYPPFNECDTFPVDAEMQFEQPFYTVCAGGKEAVNQAREWLWNQYASGHVPMSLFHDVHNKEVQEFWENRKNSG